MKSHTPSVTTVVFAQTVSVVALIAVSLSQLLISAILILRLSSSRQA